MNWPSLLTSAIVYAVAAVASADPLNGTAMPADTRWVMHADVDAARQATPLWELVRTRLIEPRQVQFIQPLGVLERITGMKVPADLHDVTLYGAAYDEGTVCLVIHGKLDEAAVTAFLRTDSEFRQQDHNGHAIMTWRDKVRDRLMYAAFAKADVVVISPSTSVVIEALDVRDGKAPGLKADSPLSPAATTDGTAAPKQPMLWMAGRNLSDLPRGQKVETPLLWPMESASVAIRWSTDRAIIETLVQTRTEEAAQQLQAVAEGFKAFAALSAPDDHAPPQARMFAASMKEMTVHAEGKTLRSEWPLKLDMIESVISLPLLPMAVPPTAPAKLP